MKLIAGEIGKNYRVEQMNLPVNIDRRLAALGMTREAKVSVLNKKKKGALIINVRGTRFAIGKHIAENIEVKEDMSDGK
ncbi:MAG: FeoA family protein [Ruminococcus sp.]|jgi:ferrous iron transport protein A